MQDEESQALKIAEQPLNELERDQVRRYRELQRFLKSSPFYVRPPRQSEHAGTVSDLRASVGPHFHLLQGSIHLHKESLMQVEETESASPTSPQRVSRLGTPLYNSVWPGTIESGRSTCESLSGLL